MATRPIAALQPFCSGLLCLVRLLAAGKRAPMSPRLSSMAKRQAKQKLPNGVPVRPTQGLLSPSDACEDILLDESKSAVVAAPQAARRATLAASKTVTVAAKIVFTCRLLGPLSNTGASLLAPVREGVARPLRVGT